MENKSSVIVSNFSLSTILAVTFIILKLCHVIEWSWIWVLAPIWIGAAFTVFVLLVLVFIAAWLRGR